MKKYNTPEMERLEFLATADVCDVSNPGVNGDDTKDGDDATIQNV